MARWSTVVALALLAGTTAAGCSKEPSIDKQEVVAMGNDVCRTGLVEVDEQFAAIPAEDVAEAERHVQKKVVAAYREMMNGLRGLGAPDDEAGHLESLYADAEGGVALIEDRPADALEGELRPFPGLDQRFENFGLTKCDLDAGLAKAMTRRAARS